MLEPLKDQMVEKYLPKEVRFSLTEDQQKLLKNEHEHRSITGRTTFFLAFAYYREYGWPLGEFRIKHLTEIEINETINTSSKMGGLDTNKVSDGYHTFGELYDHRIENFITVCRLIDDKEFNTHGGAEYGSVWRSKNHCDGEPVFGGTWFVLGINKEPGKQITYHLPISRWDECDFARELPTAPEWDGHTSANVLERLKNL